MTDNEFQVRRAAFKALNLLYGIKGETPEMDLAYQDARDGLKRVLIETAPKPEVPMIQVVSSNLKAIGYAEHVMQVEFQNGGIYRYYDVPVSVFDEIMRAESVGKFYAKYVKGFYLSQKVSI